MNDEASRIQSYPNEHHFQKNPNPNDAENVLIVEKS